MNIFIEADSIAAERMSGIGHAALEIIRAFDRLMDTRPDIKVSIIVPFKQVGFIDQYGFKNIKIRRLPPAFKYVNYLLARTSIPVPVDLFYGRGVYIFPNYKTWFVPFSTSLTYVYDVAFKKYPEATQPKNLAYLEANFNRWLRRADKVITSSKTSASEIASFFPAHKDKIEVQYLGTDPKVYYRRPEGEIKKTLAAYGLPSDYFLAVGNIEPRKNVLGMLDAFAQYADTTQNPHNLVLVGGGGWNNQDILDRIAELQRKRYPIFRPSKYVADNDLPALYSGASALLQVAFHEGFGLSPVQAQACGTPVIASDLPVFKETLSAKNIQFVDPRDTKAITRAMGAIGTGVYGAAPKGTITLTWDDVALNLLQLTSTM
jgi:glycosyltransferase involved in cell wall biosynthesis